MWKRPQNDDDLKYENDFKSEDSLKREEDLKDEDDLKKEKDLKDEDDLKSLRWSKKFKGREVISA